MKYFYKVALLLCLATILTSCNYEDDCDELRGILGSVAVQKSLLSWVDSYHNDIDRLEHDSSYSGLIRPGHLQVMADFPWHYLGFDEKAQVRLIAPITKEGKIDIKKPNAFFFGQHTGFGVLVRVVDSDTFGILEMRETQKITERILLMCSEPD